MGFGNIGIGELMMIFLVIMIVFGPKRMPGIARDMGKFLRDFRRETNAAIKELKDGIEPINVGIFDEPDASSARAAGTPGNGAAAPLPGVAAAGGAGVAVAPVEPPPSNGSRKPATARKKTATARKKTATARKPARASSSSKARRKTPASGSGRTSSSSATPKKRPAQKTSKAKSSSSARSRASRKR
jgi:TatA/E family protein of Tat protein translocase